MEEQCEFCEIDGKGNHAPRCPVYLEQKLADAEALLLWSLYHHQGGSSEVGQPIRRALGIGEYDHLTPEQIALAKETVARILKTKART